MNIAIISASYFPEYNGAAVRVDGLAYGLSSVGNKVFLIVPGDELKREEFKDWIVYRIPCKRSFISNVIEKYLKFNIRRFVSFKKYIFDIIKKEKIEIVHCRQPFEFYHLGLIIKKRFKLPVVFECHRFLSSTEYQLGNYNYILYKLIKSLERRLINKCDAVVALTETGLRNLKSDGVNRKIAIVPNSTRMPIKKTKPNLKLNKNEKLLLYAGTLRETEGLETLIEAFGILCKKSDKFKLLIVGKGGEKEKLVNLAKNLGVKDKIIFIDNISYDKISPYYLSAFAFVHPRKAIPYQASFIGLKIYDAIATHLPIITSGYGELGELIKKEGIGIATKPDDPEDFANSVLKLDSNKKLYKSIKSNLVRLAKKSSWGNSGKILEKLYRSLI